MSDYKQILDRAARLCSTGEKCQYDIREKMITWGLDEDAADKAVLYLAQNKFVDDQRFSTYFIRDKLRFNKWGRVKIRYILQQKKVAAEIIEACISEIDPELYNEILDQILLTKIKSIGHPNTAQNKAKLIRFAAQRGFTSSEIFDAIKRINN